MKISLSCLVVVLGAWPWLSSVGEHPRPSAAAAVAMTGDEQDLILFDDTRPFRLRLHLQIDGKPFPETWNQHIEHLFSFLDANGDGFLSQEEASHAPSPEQLLRQLQGHLAIDPGPAPDFRELDQAPADGKVSVEELKNFYRQSVAGPLQVELAPRSGGTANLTAALFHHLDLNKDGKLSQAELTAAADTLRPLDVKDDDLVTIEELFADGSPGTPMVRGAAGSSPLPPAATVLLIRPGDSIAELVRKVLKRYGKDAQQLLRRAEISWEKALFDQLHLNHDGELDAAELAAWLRRPPDLELVVQLGRTPAGLVVSVLKSGPLTPVGRQTHFGNLVIPWADTQLEIYRGGERPQAKRGSSREHYLRLFPMTEQGGKGVLTSKQIYQPPFHFVGLLRLADRDGDGKLSEK